MKFKKKPVVIEAIQYNGDNAKEIIDFTNRQAMTNTCYDHLTIPTLEGNHRADVGDWIIKGVAGEFFLVNLIFLRKHTNLLISWNKLNLVT